MKLLYVLNVPLRKRNKNAMKSKKIFCKTITLAEKLCKDFGTEM